jgi:hypothetical protein
MDLMRRGKTLTDHVHLRCCTNFPKEKSWRDGPWQNWQNKVEALGRVVLLVLAALGADTLDREAVKEQPLALLAVPPIALRRVGSWNIMREYEVEALGRVVLLVFAASRTNSLDWEAVKEQPLALLAVPPID